MSEDKFTTYLRNTGENFQHDKNGEEKYADAVKSMEKMQEHAEKDAKRWISEQYNVTGEELDSLYTKYGKDDQLGEFLIDGAVLRCNQATFNDFEIPNVGTIVLDKVADKDSEECFYMTLHVSENPISDGNGKCYATVKDTVFYKNIIPPKCNCSIMTDREEEIKRIMTDPECSKNVVCRHLMRLNEEWDNMILPERNYMTQTNVKSTMLSAGVEDVFGARSSFGNFESEEAEAITMTSVLFCKHGGLITPVTSGQTYQINYSYEDIIDDITANRIRQLHPQIQQSVINFIVDVQKIYPDIRIVQGLRTIEEQNALYNEGRDGNGGQIVTNAKGGSSYHNYGLAIDIGRIVDNQLSYDIDWKEVEEIGNKHGFEWGGNWTTIVDKPHFQITYNYEIKELYKMYLEGNMEDGYVILE